MNGVVYQGPRQVSVESLPEPRVRHPRDAVVRVTRSAICGTDLHPYRGHIPGFPPGTVLGHEFAGTVHDAGDEVPFTPGQRVFASDIAACGRCAACARGRHYQCDSVSLFGYADVVGTYLPGGQAEFVRVPFADVVLAGVPAGVTDEQAVMVGDTLTTGYAAASAAGIEPDGIVAVVGAGTVGLLAALCARAAGATRVVVADPIAERRAAAAALGLTAVTPGDLVSAVRDLGTGRGAGSVIEAVGTDAALLSALRAAGPNATVVAAGSHHSSATPFPSASAFARELTVRFVVGDPIRLREPVLELVRSGRVDPSAVVSHRLPLGSAAEAYAMFDVGRLVKAVLTVDGGEPGRETV